MRGVTQRGRLSSTVLRRPYLHVFTAGECVWFCLHEFTSCVGYMTFSATAAAAAATTAGHVPTYRAEEEEDRVCVDVEQL